MSIRNFEQWIKEQETVQKGNQQDLKTNSRTSYSTHSDRPRERYYYYKYVPHSDRRTGSSGYRTVRAGYIKSDTRRTHVDGRSPRHSDHMVYHRDTDYPIHWADRHSDSTSYYHSDGYKPVPTYTYVPPVTTHSDYYNHSDTGGYSTNHHSDYAGYSYSTHTDYGFNHSDFVPQTPAILGIDNNVRVKEKIKIGMYAYDHNQSGAGDQDEGSKTVLYTVKIRKVRNLNGGTDTSGWITHQNATSNSILELDTTNLLKNNLNDPSRTDGFYEIQVVASNRTISTNGREQKFESEPITKTIEVRENYDTEVSITQEDVKSFLLFDFGDITQDNSKVKRTYAEHKEFFNLTEEGLEINITANDKDDDQYLKGHIWVEDTNGNKINTKIYPIRWEDGSTAVLTNKKDLRGKAVIPKADLKSISKSSSYVIGLELKDYKDKAGTNPGGTTLTKKTLDNNTQMKFVVDVVKPTITIEKPPQTWEREQIVPITITDDLTGIDETKIELFDKRTNRVVKTDTILGNQTNYPYKIDRQGEFYLKATSKDNVGNTRITDTKGMDWSIKVDVTPPELEFSFNPDGWAIKHIDITAKGTDEHSGVKFIKTPDNRTHNQDGVTFRVTKNGTYKFIIEDNAGMSETYDIVIDKIDDVLPEMFDLKLNSKTDKSLELEFDRIEDKQSGIDLTPGKGGIEYTIDGGKTWVEVNYENILNTPNGINVTELVKGLKPNTEYKIKGRIRDKSGNIREVDIGNNHTLTAGIDLSALPRTETQGYVDLVIDMGDNISGTETQITKRNLTTGESYVIKNWNDSNKYRDYDTNFVLGYQYTAIARNKDHEIGEPSSLIIRDKEQPDLIVNGYGMDKFVFNNKTSNLFLFGEKTSGMMDWRIMTRATDNLEVTVGAGKLDPKEIVFRDTLYGRTGDYGYKAIVKALPKPLEVYEISARAKYTSGKKVVESEIDFTKPKVTVNHIKHISDLIDLDIKDNGDGSLTINQKPETPSSNLKEHINNALKDDEVRKMLADMKVVDNDGKTQNLKPGQDVVIPEADFNLEIELPNGDKHRELITNKNINLKTNIRSYVTELKKEKDSDKYKWQLEGDLTIGDKGYGLPEQLNKLGEDGYGVEVVILEGETRVDGDSKAEKFNNIKSKGKDIKFEDVIFDEPNIAVIGLKVTGKLPKYYIHTLNLQFPNDGSNRNSRLEAIGNVNIEYDDKFLYNKITNTMKAHNQKILTNQTLKNWNSELYYRTDGKDPKLIMVLRDKIVTFDPVSLEKLEELPKPNTGSMIVQQNLIVASSKGLEELNTDLQFSKTVYSKPVTAITNNGSNIFVTDGSKLEILNNSLGVDQTMDSSEIFGSSKPIVTLHSSNGRVYVGDSEKTNEYIEIGR